MREDTRPPVILALDDSNEVLMSLSAMLSGHDLRTVKNSNAAFSVLRQERVVAILLDIEMPRMNGFEFMEFIRREDRYADIPVIFITGNADAASVLKAKQLGAKGYIVKPLKAEEVRRKVNEALEASHT